VSAGNAGGGKNVDCYKVLSGKFVDRISKARRSWNMAQIGPKDTSPELAVRALLRDAGLRFRMHISGLPGTPDLVLPEWETALFVNGCFWHRHPKCRFAYTPKTRSAFWKRKFHANVRRDKDCYRALKALGWRVVLIWECETRDLARLKRRIERIFPISPAGRASRLRQQ